LEFVSTTNTSCLKKLYYILCFGYENNKIVNLEAKCF
jgi:hypothetical protein